MNIFKTIKNLFGSNRLKFFDFSDNLNLASDFNFAGEDGDDDPGDPPAPPPPCPPKDPGKPPCPPCKNNKGGAAPGLNLSDLASEEFAEFGEFSLALPTVGVSVPIPNTGGSGALCPKPPKCGAGATVTVPLKDGDGKECGNVSVTVGGDGKGGVAGSFQCTWGY